MDLAALADPDDSEKQRARLRASADRDAMALTAGLEDVAETPAAFAETADHAEPEVPAVPDPIATYREVSDVASVRLRFPFEIEGIEVSAVSMVPPTFADVEALTAGRISEIEMFARMCGLPVAALRAMRWPDVETVTLFARHLAPELQRR